MKKVFLFCFFIVLLNLYISSQTTNYNFSIMGSLNIIAADYHDSISASLCGSFGKILLPKTNFLESSLEAGLSLALRTTYTQNSIYFFIPDFLGSNSKWTRTDTLTVNNSLALNGYLKFNFFVESKFSPFLGLNLGVSTFNSKITSETRESDDFEKPWQEWSFVSKTTTYGDSFTSGNIGVSIGFNYFVNYNLSFTAQYDLSIPTANTPTFDTISWGVRYWF